MNDDYEIMISGLTREYPEHKYSTNEMIDHLGKSVILNPGDMFHCIKGAKHIFNVLQPVRKLMFLFHDS